MSKSIEIKKKRAFSSVPDDILTDTQMSIAARLVLAYLVGRPDGWTVHVWQVCAVLGIGASRWVGVRKELTASGYLQQQRKKTKAGRWEWQHIVSDTPFTT